MNQFKHQDNPMGKVPVFNGVNMRYSVWAMRVRNYMLERDCWLAVSEGDNDEEYERMIRSLSESQQAQYRQMYGRAMGIIGNAVGGALTKIVSGPTIRGDPRKAWFALKQLYDRRDDEEISRLSASIFARTWGKDDNVQTVMGDVIDAYDEITAAQGVLSESMVVNHVLNILPDKYRNVAQIIRVTQRQLDLRELLKMLLLEQARARTKTQSQHQPLIAYAQKGDARKDKRRCWNCDKPGHLSKDCRSRKKKTPGHGRKPRRDQDRTRQYRHEKTFKLAETAHVTSTAAAGDNGWLVDSGATTHVSSVRDDFLTLSEESVDVTLADGSTVTATGRGTVRLQTSAGAVTMTDVLYLPRGQARIISMGKIMEKGNDVYSKAGSLYITFPDRTQIQLQKRDELYFLPQTTTSATTAAAVQENTATSATTATAIHENMGHRACDPCIKGKMRNANSKKFSGNSNNSYKPGEMLCADLTGPHPPTLTGGRFAVVLLDVATQYSSVGLMATKKDLANTLDSMLMTLPRAMGIGHRVNTLKTDNEPLFSTPAMLKVLHKHKLDMRHSPPYRPEKNGDVERHIQTLTSTARTLLIDARLPTEFWGCALLHASHVHNHLKPLQRLKLHPVVQDMKQFGVTAYVRDRNGDKWRPRTWTGIYVGFNPQCRAHKIYNPESHNVISTYDVRFLTMEESWLRPVLHQREDFLPPSLDLAQRPLPSTTTTTTHEPVMTQQQQTHEPVMTQQQRMHQPVQIQRQPQREKQKQARRVRKQPQQQTTHRKQTSPVQSLPPQQTTPVQALPPQQTTPVQSLPPQQTSVQTLPTQHKQASEPPQQLTQTTQPPQQVQHMTQPPQQVQHMTPTTSDQGPRRSARIRAQQQKTTAAKATAAQARAGFEEAERSEMDSLRRHGVLERVEEKGYVSTPVLPTMFVYSTKSDGKRKARLVVRGDLDQHDTSTYSPTASRSTLLTLMASTTAPLMVMDVTTAFLHADLPRDVHVKIRGEVFRLHKALYGLKDSPRLFHQHIHSILTRLSWQATITDPCLYTRQHQQHGQTYLMVYVDDLLYVGGGQKEVVEELRPHLQIKHKQGQQHDYLGIRITRTTTSAATTTSTTTTISLTPYLSAIAGIGPFRVSTPITIDHGRQIQGGGKEGAMVSGGGRADNKEQTRQQQLPLTQQKQHKHRLKEYQQVLGTLTYAASTARPDLAYAASVLASKIGHVSTHDVQMARRALQYAKSHNNILTTTVEHTTGAAACGYYTTAQLSDLEKGQQFPTAQIVTYVDASFAMDAGRRSRSGIVICVNNMPVYWRSSKQTITALSAAEAEYSAITEGIKHTIHVRDQLDEMMIKHSTPVILTDSMSAIHMANSDKIQERTKHLGIRMQFTRDHVRKQTVELQHVPSGDQVADMLTKPLHKGAFHRLVQKIMHHE